MAGDTSFIPTIVACCVFLFSFFLISFLASKSCKSNLLEDINTALPCWKIELETHYCGKNEAEETGLTLNTDYCGKDHGIEI